MKFTVTHEDGAARRGKLVLRHGEVDTPQFMPVGTAASVKSLTTEQLKSLSPQSSVLSPQIILNNTYHLILRPGIEVVERM